MLGVRTELDDLLFWLRDIGAVEAWVPRAPQSSSCVDVLFSRPSAVAAGNVRGVVCILPSYDDAPSELTSAQDIDALDGERSGSTPDAGAQ